MKFYKVQPQNQTFKNSHALTHRGDEDKPLNTINYSNQPQNQDNGSMNANCFNQIKLAKLDGPADILISRLNGST